MTNRKPKKPKAAPSKRKAVEGDVAFFGS